MSRLPDKENLTMYDQLRYAWTTDDRPFSYLSAREQWDLHAFFKPSEDLTSAELLAHRRHVSKQDPVLPQRAGRAWSLFLDGVVSNVRVQQRHEASVRMKRKRTKIGHGTALAVLRPEPDTKRLVQALIHSALEQARSEAVTRSDADAGGSQVPPDNVGTAAKGDAKRG